MISTILMSLTLTYTPHWLQRDCHVVCFFFSRLPEWPWLLLLCFTYAICIYMQAFIPIIEFTHCVHRFWELTWHAGHMSSTGRVGCNFTTASVMCIMLLQATPVASFDFSHFKIEASFYVVLPCDTGSTFCPLICLYFLLRLYPGLFYPHPPLPTAVHAWCLVSPSGPHWGLPLSSADNYCHLHLAQCDKHLALPVASRGTTALV